MVPHPGGSHGQVHTGNASRLSDVPTVNELIDRYKTPEPGGRLASVILAGGALGRPMLGPPGIPAERVKILREAFAKTMKDPGFLDDIKRGTTNWDQPVAKSWMQL